MTWLTYLIAIAVCLPMAVWLMRGFVDIMRDHINSQKEKLLTPPFDPYKPTFSSPPPKKVPFIYTVIFWGLWLLFLIFL